NALQVLAGVGLFLYGIKLLSDALQCLAGDKMRQLIGTLTRTPFRGVLVGAVVTVLIQSSTGVTVMTVSFVNAGLMMLSQAIGVIMGANIGTTVTAQLIAFKIKNIALPFIALGAFLYLFGGSRRLKYFGHALMGIGLVFLGMQTMEGGMTFLRDRPELFMALSNPIFGVIAGTVVTILVQSSAATIGLTMAMASQGLLSIDMAIPIILGDNIGTTVTAVLAAIGTSRSAKQAAAAHVLFNTIGVLIFMIAMPLFKSAVLLSASDIGRQLANAHTMFNVINTLLFLPFARPFARLIKKIVPSDEKRVDTGPVYLDEKLIAVSPAAAVEAVKDELRHMGQVILDMVVVVRRGYDQYSDQVRAEFDEKEQAVNNINRGISKYASGIWQRRVSEEVSSILGKYVSVAGDLERIGDHLENLLELSVFKQDNGVHFSPQADVEFWDMFDTAETAVRYALAAILDENLELADTVIHELEDSIDGKEQEYRANHIGRLTRQECDPERGVIFADVLSNLERIGDHSHNIAYFARDIATM
ncbi:Na/Pi cotransporter family protein, partial [Desulfovibrio sp. OttesenSCG-928-I05]|nr:Na/Pi cotransporter family protein [Desulfovibrio sp. OttesenSCG-928-I05]